MAKELKNKIEAQIKIIQTIYPKLDEFKKKREIELETIQTICAILEVKDERIRNFYAKLDKSKVKDKKEEELKRKRDYCTKFNEIKEEIEAQVRIIQTIYSSADSFKELLMADDIVMLLRLTPFIRAEINCFLHFAENFSSTQDEDSLPKVMERYIYEEYCIRKAVECDHLFRFEKYFNLSLKKIPFNTLFDLFTIFRKKTNVEEILKAHLDNRDNVFFETLTKILTKEKKEITTKKAQGLLINTISIYKNDFNNNIVPILAPPTPANNKYSMQKNENYDKVKKYFQRAEAEKENFKKEYEKFIQAKEEQRNFKEEYDIFIKYLEY